MRIRRREPDPAGLHALTDCDPVLRRIYAARGVTDPSALRRDLRALAPTDGLSGLDAAVAELAAAVTQQQRIVLVGDFDVDGASSCALAVLSLQAMGATDVQYLVPDRFAYGYGLGPAVVAEACKLEPDLLVTVDNGVASVDGVAAANEAGIRVVVTDHHLPPAELPAAAALVNPQLPGDRFPSKNLAGVGVIFYVLAGLRRELEGRGWFSATHPSPAMADLLDLVALGTVADLVTLDRNNRVMVEQGLRRIRAGRCRPGLSALLEQAGRDPSVCTATDLAFAAAPRLNAAGRLEDMGEGIACLLAETAADAQARAARLDRLNQERRSIEARMEEQALAGLTQAADRLGDQPTPPALCVADSDWHPGIVGILASRLRERYHRPVIAFAPEGEAELKGSARSVPGLHIRDVLERVATENPGVIHRFGGHAAAAGLTIPADSLSRFHDAFVDTVDVQLPEAEREGICLTDGALEPELLTVATARRIEAGGPWGNGFPEPVFDDVFDIVDARVVGSRHLKLRVAHRGGSAPVEAIAFRAVDAGWACDSLPPQPRLVYRLQINRWRGQEVVQLVVEHILPD